MSAHDKAQGPSQFVTEAYQVEDEASVVEFYGKWATDYDNQMNGLGYVSPTMIAEDLHAHMGDPKATVLDLGCGTGLTCTYLAERGYQSLDGIDLSPDMVRVASERGIYRELLVGDITKPLARDSSQYDGVICSGTFTHGHVGPEPLDEVHRILRAGGILACTVHQDLWELLGFDKALAAMVSSGRFKQLSLRRDIYYRGGEPEGWFCVYQKT